MVLLRSAPHDEEMLAAIRLVKEQALGGDVHGIAIVVDHGGGEFSYTGHGSLVRNKLIGHAVVLKLAQKFL